jgi:hypothetical protein
MIARSGSGWQTVLADLSLILFMVMATAVSETPGTVGGPVESEPVAQWRGAEDAPGLRDWLAAQPQDPRQQLTIVAPLAAAQQALVMARGSDRPARIVLDPRAEGAPIAILAFDQLTEEPNP